MSINSPFMLGFSYALSNSDMENKELKFVVRDCGIAYEIKTFPGEYRNLMVLLSDKIVVEDFGECGGLGRCATCMVRVKNLRGISNVKDRNEPATLAKKGVENADVRLSCQLMITEDLDGTEIEILDQYEL